MKPKVLLQFDGDKHPSSFDSVVAVDAGVDQLLSFGDVATEDIEGLIHGAMFTRGPADLRRTAAFFGGSDVTLATRLFERAQTCFFGPIRISMMADPNGANTTAAAAVLCAGRHMEVAGRRVVVLGGTGPVGCRIAELVATQEARVLLASRKRERAETVCEEIKTRVGQNATIEPIAIDDSLAARECLKEVDVVFAAGAAGVELIPSGWLQSETSVRIAVDLNAVPPAGIGQVEASDAGLVREGVTCYGAVGVGGLKMKIHRAAIQSLFESNDAILELNQIFEIGREIESV
ncbi:MAG: methylenetetrahydromethanopterin dehydrogenase [Mariniblastus sp.]|nr:methylenetetrahydromethanopterin dehydrogenase [Mariniblastus sp.]